MTKPELLLTTEQVAVEIGKSVSTVNRLAKNGVLEPAFQAPGIRGNRLYDPDDVSAYKTDMAVAS